MIQDNIRYAGHISVARDGHNRDLYAFGNRRVHRDQSLHGPLLQKEWIFFNEFIAMPVADHKIEVALLKQMILNSGHDQCRIAFADLRHDHPDRIAALLPE